MKFTNKAEVVKIEKINKHPNADSLGIVQVYDYNCCVKLTDFQEGDLAVYVPPDSVVNTSRPEFAFLGKHNRIKAVKLRGVISYGLLIKAPENSKLGDDVVDMLEITHWEPEINHKAFLLTGGESAKPPSGIYPKYDVDSYLRWGREVFKEGELVTISEKIHGCSGKWLYQNKTMYCGSRTEFKKEFSSPPQITLDELTKQFNGDEQKANLAYNKILNFKPKKNLWWKALENTPNLKSFCEENPNYAVYGEVYGNVQKNFNYDCKKDEYKIAVFDIYYKDNWLNFAEFMELCQKYNLPHVPILEHSIPFDFELMKEYANGNSTIGDNIKEGCVVKTLIEKWNECVGRVQFKIINPEFYNG